MADGRAKVPEELQRQGGASPGVARQVARSTGAGEAHVYGVASFFSLLARPDDSVRVCTGVSCLLRGAGELLEAAKRAGFPVTESSCLAACDVAPGSVGTLLSRAAKTFRKEYKEIANSQ